MKKILTGSLAMLALLGVTACNDNNSSESNSDVSKNTYKISFYLNDQEYKTYSIEKGSYLTETPALPTVEGYSVSWSINDFSNIQTDTIVNAVLTANSYNISFYLDGVLLETKTFKYGEEVIAPTVNVSDGYIFTGFSGMPDKMTSGDLSLYGYTKEVDEVINLSTLEEDYILEITSGGTYYFTGNSINNGIMVNTSDSVTIYLSDIDVESLKQAFIYVEKASVVNIISNNVILETSSSITDDAVIVSNSPVVLSGVGNMEISSIASPGILVNKSTIDVTSGSYLINATGNGIQAKGKGSTLTISGGSLDITSTSTALKSKGDITISNAILNISSEADSINTEGSVIITSGTLDINSTMDAIQGDTGIEISGGTINLSSGGGVSSDAALTTSSDFVFEVEDTTDFTEEDFYGLYVLVNQTYVEIDSDNYNTYKSYLVFYDKKSQRGLKSDGTINITGGALTIDSLDDGIKTDTIFNQTGGSISISSKSDGIQGDEKIEITGGVITINTTGTFYQTSQGRYNKNGSSYTKGESGSYDMYVSNKGLKSDSLIYITDGSFNITSDDDSIHSNDYVTILGGTLNLTSLDDGIHSDTILSIGEESGSSDLVLNVLSSYEGLEGASIYVYYGNISVVSSDDGLNAAGGSDSTSGQDSFRPGGAPGGWHKASTSSTTTEEYNIYINGGVIIVNTLGDGIDSNGSIYLNGGTVLVFGPSDNGNAAIDYGDTSSSGFYVTGGSIVAIGSSGMAQTPSTGSYVSFTLKNSISAGVTVTLKLSDGTVVYSFTTIRSANSIILGGDLIKSSTNYSLYSNDSLIATASSITK